MAAHARKSQHLGLKDKDGWNKGPVGGCKGEGFTLQKYVLVLAEHMVPLAVNRHLLLGAKIILIHPLCQKLIRSSPTTFFSS